MVIAAALTFPFDEIERLRATVGAAKAFAAGNEPLEAVLAAAGSFLATPSLLAGPAAPEALRSRVADAFEQGRNHVDKDYLPEQPERPLLTGRHYQRRKVFGASHIRCLLNVDQASGKHTALPTYIPAELAESLPMFTRFRARLIGDLCLREDQYESHPAALRAHTLARVVPRALW